MLYAEDAKDAEYAEDVEYLGSSVEEMSHLFRARKTRKVLRLQTATEGSGGLQKPLEGCRIRVTC